jgi:hypothetical protein
MLLIHLKFKDALIGSSEASQPPFIERSAAVGLIA